MRCRNNYYFFNSLLYILIGLELLIKTTTLLILTNICMKLKLMRTKIFNTLFSLLPLMTKMNVSSPNGRNDWIPKLFCFVRIMCLIQHILIFSVANSLWDYKRKLWWCICRQKYDWSHLCGWTSWLWKPEKGKYLLQNNSKWELMLGWCN